MTYVLDDKVNEFVNRTAKLIKSTHVDIFNRVEILHLLNYNGYNVTFLKPFVQKRKNSSIALRISEKDMPAQTLKIHPDVFDYAKIWYNHLDLVEDLVNDDLIVKINWTKAVKNSNYTDRIRVVFYDYQKGPTLNKLPFRVGELIMEEWGNKIYEKGFLGKGTHLDDIVLTRSGFSIRPILTDYNKLARIE